MTTVAQLPGRQPLFARSGEGPVTAGPDGGARLRDPLVDALVDPLTAPAVARAPRGGPPVQGLFINQGLDDDLAYKRVYSFLVSRGSSGETLAPGAEATITTTNAAEPIEILLHGGRPTAEQESSVLHWSPSELLEKLEASGFDASKHTGNITLLACHAGYSLDGKAPSFAASFAEILKKKGYVGKVLAVEGSVQPPHSGKQDPESDDATLWQSDPADAHLKDLHTAYIKGADPIYDVQNYLDGDDEPKPFVAVATTRTYASSLIDALGTYYDVCAASLAGFDDYKDQLALWNSAVIEHLQVVLTLTNGKAGTAIATLDKADDLNDALTALRGQADTLDELRKAYASARTKKSGYVQGFTDLFKPLSFLQF